MPQEKRGMENERSNIYFNESQDFPKEDQSLLILSVPSKDSETLEDEAQPWPHKEFLKKRRP
jgi:hypothetical protein